MKIKYIIILLLVFCGCIPTVFMSSYSFQAIDKNSPIYISKFDGISMEEIIFREKLNTALERKGYYIVNNFQKSKYYLITNFNNRIQKNLDQNKDVEIFSMEFFLLESKDITNSSNLLSGVGEALWVCNIELNWLEYLNYQDDVVATVVKNFCNKYYGKKILF